MAWINPLMEGNGGGYGFKTARGTIPKSSAGYHTLYIEVGFRPIAITVGMRDANGAGYMFAACVDESGTGITMKANGNIVDVPSTETQCVQSVDDNGFTVSCRGEYAAPYYVLGI